MAKRLTIALMCVLFTGCGYSARDSELIGQVKKVVRVTPIFCPEYVSADISLGVLRNGVGSMSTADEWVRVMNTETERVLKRAAETGELVKVKFSIRRAALCYADHNAEWAEIVR